MTVQAHQALLDQVKRRHLLVRVLQHADYDKTQVKDTILTLLATCEHDLRATKYLQPSPIKRLFGRANNSSSTIDVTERSALHRKTKEMVKQTREQLMDTKDPDPELASGSAIRKVIYQNEHKNEAFVNSIIFWRVITLAWGRISMVVSIAENCELDPFALSLDEDDQIAMGDLVFVLCERLRGLEKCGRILLDWLSHQDSEEVPSIDYLASEFERLPFFKTMKQIGQLSEQLPMAKRLEVAMRRFMDSATDFGSVAGGSDTSSDSVHSANSFFSCTSSNVTSLRNAKSPKSSKSSKSPKSPKSPASKYSFAVSARS